MKKTDNNFIKDNVINNDDLIYYAKHYKKIYSYNIFGWIITGIIIASFVVCIVLSIVLSTVIFPTFGKIGAFSTPLCLSIACYSLSNSLYGKEIAKLHYVSFVNNELEELRLITVNSSYFKKNKNFFKLCKKAKEIYYFGDKKNASKK